MKLEESIVYQSIANDEFYQKQKKKSLSILDVREREEFASGHIPNAHNLPLSQLSLCSDKLNKNTSYYVICQSGRRSAQACTFLSSHGYQVTNVMGGMSTWKGQIE